MTNYVGDYDASAVIYNKFTTYQPSTGASFALAGTPALAVFKDASTAQVTSVVLTVSFDGITGLNHWSIDTGLNPTFFSTGSFFDVYIAAGTVDSVSVVGAAVASFTIRKDSSLKPTTAGNTLDVTATGAAGVDWGNVENKTTANALTATTISTSQVVSQVVNSVGSVTGNVGGTISTSQIITTVTGNVGRVLVAVTSNVHTWLGQAIPTPVQTGVPIVDTTYLRGTQSVGAVGYVGVDWQQVRAATSVVTLTNTTISAAQVVASVTGAVGSVTGNVGGTISTSQVITQVTGSVGSVSGAVGSVTGNVGGSVASVVGNVGGTISTSQIITQVTGSVGSVVGNVLGTISTSQIISQVTGSVGSVVSAVGITSNRKKAAEAVVMFTMTDDGTGADLPGLTVAAAVSKDGASFSASSNSVTEIGEGWYTLTITNTEMNANNIGLRFSATGATVRDLMLQTQP